MVVAYKSGICCRVRQLAVGAVPGSVQATVRRSAETPKTKIAQPVRWSGWKPGGYRRHASRLGIRLALCGADLFTSRGFSMLPAISSFGLCRAAKPALTCVLGAVLWSTTALAADKVTFLTSWFAQAEHGGFYQAKATGPLREGRPRRHDQDGRPAGQRHAAAARRRDRRHDGLRPPGAQDAGAGPAGHHRRHVVPVRPAGHDDA